MNFPGEFYYSNNYIDCIYPLPPKNHIIEFWTYLSELNVISTEWLILHLDIYFSVYIHVSVKIMYISVSCQRFLDFIANDRLCVSLKNFQFVRFLASWLFQPFFFSRWYIIFCFRIFKVFTYTSTSIFIWEETECYIMYIERWISLFWLDKLRMYKSIFSNNVTMIYMSF